MAGDDYSTVLPSVGQNLDFLMLIYDKYYTGVFESTDDHRHHQIKNTYDVTETRKMNDEMWRFTSSIASNTSSISTELSVQSKMNFSPFINILVTNQSYCTRLRI